MKLIHETDKQYANYLKDSIVTERSISMQFMELYKNCKNEENRRLYESIIENSQTRITSILTELKRAL